MKIQNELENHDLVILVFHPSNAPNIVSADGALEFDSDGSIALPVQKQFKDLMVRVLTDFAVFRQSPVVNVESRLRVDPHNETEFPATHVVRLVGNGVSVNDVEVYRAAAQFTVREFIAQRSIDEIDMEHFLSEDEKVFLSDRAQEIAEKFANKTITQGFVIRFGPADHSGVIVQGVMAPLLIEEKANTTIRGCARPIGFDENRNTIILFCDEAANDSGESPFSKGPMELRCYDAQMLFTVAQAYVNRAHVSYTALVQRAAKTKKAVLTLTGLWEVEGANDSENFELD